jgi:hypothetical protein
MLQHQPKLNDFLQKYKTKGIIKDYVTDGMNLKILNGFNENSTRAHL